MNDTMNPVTHFEVPYKDGDRVAAFYEKVFGWRIQKLGKDMNGYVLATTANKDARPDAFRGTIDGGFFPKKPDWPAQYPSIVVGVTDIQETMQKIEKAGGEVLGEPDEIPDVGQYVSFTDTEGNRLAMLQPANM